MGTGVGIEGRCARCGVIALFSGPGAPESAGGSPSSRFARRRGRDGLSRRIERCFCRQEVLPFAAAV